MIPKKITVKAENGKGIEVAVVDMSPNAVTIAIGEGIHNVRCRLVPTESGRAYVGSVMGREVVYEASVDAVRQLLGEGKVERKPVKR